MGFEVQRNSFYKSSRVIEHMHHCNLGKGQHSKPTSSQNPQAIVWITGDISEISFSVIGDTVAMPYECVLEKKKIKRKKKWMCWSFLLVGKIKGISCN